VQYSNQFIVKIFMSENKIMCWLFSPDFLCISAIKEIHPRLQKTPKFSPKLYAFCFEKFKTRK